VVAAIRCEIQSAKAPQTARGPLRSKAGVLFTFQQESGSNAQLKRGSSPAYITRVVDEQSLRFRRSEHAVKFPQVRDHVSFTDGPTSHRKQNHSDEKSLLQRPLRAALALLVHPWRHSLFHHSRRFV
jgi:hypothetical protein